MTAPIPHDRMVYGSRIITGYAPRFSKEHDMTTPAEQLLEDATQFADDIEAWFESRRDDKSIPIKQMVAEFWRIKAVHDDLKKQVTRLYHVVNSLDKGVLPARFEDEGVDMIRIPELARSFSVRTNTSASMIDKDGAMEWLKETGNGDLIQATVNAGTLASLCRNLVLEQGIEPPEELIKVTTYNSIGSNKYNPK